MARHKTILYRCPVCETIVEVLEPCGLELICCGPAMVELSEAQDDSPADHSPLVRWNGHTVKVSPCDGHAMDEDHRIAWIEVCAGPTCYRTFFKPGQRPEVSAKLTCDAVTVRLYCTQHGLHKTVSERPGRTARQRAS